jgi:DNA-directed RNA polymerase subunit RPC12/RpoP
MVTIVGSVTKPGIIVCVVMRRIKMAFVSGDIYIAGARFMVICTRCGHKFEVIRNWGGGIRIASNENVNPAKCPKCDSRLLEVY